MPFSGFPRDGIRFFRELERRVASLEKKGFEVASMETLEHQGLGLMFPEFPKGLQAGPKLGKWIVDQPALAAPVILWIEEQLA